MSYTLNLRVEFPEDCESVRDKQFIHDLVDSMLAEVPDGTKVHWEMITIENGKKIYWGRMKRRGVADDFED